MRTYITISIGQLGNIDFNQIQETNQDTVRKSLDDSEFVAKWEGSTPETISNIPDSEKSQEMTYAQTLILMRTPEWTTPFE